MIDQSEATKALQEALLCAHREPYTTKGRVWRQIIASLAFETNVDLSLIQYLDEYDQARFHIITQAFMDRVLPVAEIMDHYLEFFPRPKDWKDFE